LPKLGNSFDTQDVGGSIPSPPTTHPRCPFYVEN
jgi:hypothetical protein